MTTWAGMISRVGSAIAACLAWFVLTTTAADAVAQTPTISGNGWLALAILIGFVVSIVLVVMVATGLARRDAARSKANDGGGFSIFGGSDDD